MEKFSFIVVLSALLAVSCSEDPLSSDNGSGERITFVTASYSQQTKADFTGSSFHVNAWTSGGIRYMKDVEVSQATGGNVWATSDAYYWPKADNLRFVATHGRNNAGTGPWAAIDDGCTSLSTGSYTFRPVVSSVDKLLLFTDRTAEYTYTSGHVPIIFKNALASVSANVIMRMGDDVIKKDSKGEYRLYDTLATNPVYYVVPFGFSPNGDLPPSSHFPYPDEPYPVKVKLQKPITHIWRIVATKIKAVQVGNQGSLSMTLASDGTWTKPSSGVWTVPDNLAAHSDSVVLYDAKAQGDLSGTPIPANLNDFNCPVSSDYLVMPQNLNWSPLSTINNQKTDVNLTVEVYNADTNGDGIFDYRDVYKYYVVKTKDSTTGAVTDSTLVSNATEAKAAKDMEFYKWYEWDGSGSSVLFNVHELYRLVLNPMYRSMGLVVPEVTFAQILDGLTPHLKYPLSTTIDLAKISSDEATKSWKMNTRTTYNISISPVTNEITFSPEVTQWTDLGNATAK